MEKRIEMVKSMLTRENLLKIFKSFGIQKGMLVLVETNGSLESYIAGGEQMVIEVLKEMLGNQGCIIAPSFTFDTLDPSTEGIYRYEYPCWEEIRESILGFDKKISQSQDSFANQMLRNPESARSSHPVYSFVFLGRHEESWLKQKNNYPISLDSVFEGLKNKKLGVLSFDKSLMENCVFYALCRKKEDEEVFMLRAYKKRGREKEVHTFLMNQPSFSKIQAVLNEKEIRKEAGEGYEISYFALDKCPEINAAASKKMDSSSGPKRSN